MAETPDLSALSSSFLKFGGKVFAKNVNDFDAKMKGILVMKKVGQPVALPKISAQGNPRPYSATDHTTGNGVAFTDRILTVYQSKWDFDVDPEKYRNTYLNDGSDNPFYKHVLDQISKEYLASINDNTAYLGSYNAAGTTAAAIATGWGTIIAAEITATNLTPVTTAAHTTSNAVANAEAVVEAAPVWMKKKGMIVFCSFGFFEKYKKNYRASYGYSFNANAQGSFMLDNINAELVPVSWMGTSSRLIATVENNLVMGTDLDTVAFPSSVRRNILEVRALMPIGFQIADLDAIVVNDLA